MPNRLLFLFCLLLLVSPGVMARQQPASPGEGRPSLTVARNSLTGRITDAATHLPLAGASIYFPDLKHGTMSGSDGKYRLENLPEGRHLVEVSYVGYASLSEYIELAGEVEHNFSLSPSILENNEVVVTGVSSALQSRRSPVPISIVKKADLMGLVSGNLVDALSRQPGVSQVSTGPAISKPIIRGLGYNRVVVVNDGVRQEGQQWGDEHGIEIDQFSVSKVEILKGPASLMYGSDALAGVINVITNVTAPEGALTGSLLYNYQTNNRLNATALNLAGTKNGFNWNVWGTLKRAADYRNRYDGPVFNSRFREANAGGLLGYNGSWGYSHLIFSSFNQKLGLIEGDRDSLGRFIMVLPNGDEVPASGFNHTDPRVPYQIIHHQKLISDNNLNIGRNRLALNLGVQRNQRMEFGNPANPGEKELYFDLNTLTYSAVFHIHEMGGWRTAIGVNGMLQQNRNKGIEVLIPEYRIFDLGAFVFTQRNWRSFSVSGGLRFDNRSVNSKPYEDAGTVKFNAFQTQYSNVSASAGMSYLVSKRVTLRANLARGFRAPSIPELSSNGAHEGTNRYEYGENGLKSETSFQADAGLDINTEHVSFTASLFSNTINHFIYYRKLASSSGGDSLVNANGSLIPAYQFDQQKAALAGVEMRVDIHPHPLDWLHFENTFSFTRGKFRDAIDGSRNLPLMPAARLLSELKGEFLPRGKHLRNVSVHLEADINFAQDHPFTAYETETATPGYTLLNTGLSADYAPKKRRWFTLYLSCNNLADIAYQNHLSRLKYTDSNPLTGRAGVFNTGRNFSLKLEIPLEGKL